MSPNARWAQPSYVRLCFIKEIGKIHRLYLSTTNEGEIISLNIAAETLTQTEAETYKDRLPTIGT